MWECSICGLPCHARRCLTTEETAFETWQLSAAGSLNAPPMCLCAVKLPARKISVQLMLQQWWASHSAARGRGRTSCSRVSDPASANAGGQAAVRAHLRRERERNLRLDLDLRLPLEPTGVGVLRLLLREGERALFLCAHSLGDHGHDRQHAS